MVRRRITISNYLGNGWIHRPLVGVKKVFYL